MGTMAIDGILHFMTQPPLGRQPEIAWRPMPVAVPCQSRKANTGGGNPRTSIASIVPPSPMEIATWTCGGLPAGSVFCHRAKLSALGGACGGPTSGIKTEGTRVVCPLASAIAIAVHVTA